MKVFKLNEDLGQAVLDYFSKQPYSEVFKLIAGLQNLEELKTVEKSK